MRKTALFSQLIVAAIAVSSVSAQADVLEIGDDGATWIAGGPDTIGGPPAEAPAQVLQQPEAASVDVHALAVTVPVAAAGPASWSARVAQLSAKYDLSPALIEALVWQESRWRHDAVSPVGARGLAQLMPGTARQLGVNPDDPNSNLEGGARYLRQQLDAFGGNLEKALAAYNAGPGRVRQAGGVPAIRETQQYVSAIIGRLAAPVRK
ncbi:MAG: lytic transglycosylase domain-containing protein [Novosphingobium sp.]|nr:lytic transglycosylase domain-containing protein [Novosphingobium sp.]